MYKKMLAAGLVAGTLFPSLALLADPSIEEIIVFGRAEEQVGSALAASEGLVGYDDFDMPPLLRVGELVESVPGMVATQHSGTGKANQYFLRGFNLDHGTDFSVIVDGVPVNFRSHGHGQGYLDLNFLIPELVATNRYRKGPYHADTGDFSSAGSASFSLYERLPENVAQLTVGKDSYTRFVAAGTLGSDERSLTLAVDTTGYDGPWQLEEDLSQHKFHASGAFPMAGGRAKVSLNAYDASWDATDQVPERVVEQGLIDRLGFIDGDLGGETTRVALDGHVGWSGIETGGYWVHYDFALFSNFTYFLNDPVNGDEFEQRDSRDIYGAWVRGDRAIGDDGLVLRWGANVQRDEIDEVGLYNTVARSRINTMRQDEVQQTSLAAWAQVEASLTETLRAYGGLRADRFSWDVVASRTPNSGDGNDALVSPKAGLAWTFAPGFEAYVSYGRGFHSNDVRGATISIDPATGSPVDPVDVLIASTGSEIGVRYELGRTFNATLAVFDLELDSELVYVGDGGTTEPNDGTNRNGIEVTAFWQPNDTVSLNAAWTVTDAEFFVDQGGGVEIPGAVRDTLSLGANATLPRGLTASVRLRYLGEAPLVEDDSVRSDDSLLVNAGAAWRRGDIEFRLDVFNLLDAEDNDIAYFYESRLAAEPAPIEDIHFHPLEPRSWRASVTWHLR